ncbi:MAG: tetratricopeptide repeat protein [Bacteroidales bacterium]|nr:tetratricopeptide repeat protein [Bacteroidales bacterium]
MKKLLQNEWFWIFVILLTTLISYSRIVFYDFVYWDDDKQIFNNIYVTKLTWNNIVYNFNHERFTLIPLTLYSILFNIVGKNAFYFHFFSIVFHLINIMLFYKVLKQFNLSFFVTIFSVILFSLHPLRIESVAWISEWKDLLFTMFSLAGILAYLYWTKNNNIIYLLLYALMFLFSAFSKIQGMILPFTIILLDIFIYKKFRILFFIFNILIFIYVLYIFSNKAKYILILLIIIYFIYRKLSNYKEYNISTFIKNILLIVAFLICISISLWFLFTKQLFLWEGNLTFNFFDRILFSGYALTFYLKQFFFPISQIPIHPYPEIQGQELFASWWPYLFSWFFIAFILLYFLYKGKYKELLGVLFFLLNISIVLHFVSIEGRLIVAERYTYFAYSGLFITLSLIIQPLVRHFEKFIHFSFLLLISFLAVIIFHRTQIWKDTETLFYSVVQKKPKTTFAWLNLGSYYLEKKQFDKSIKCYEIAINIDPEDSQLYLNRAITYAAKGKVNLALLDLKKALSISKFHKEKSLILVTIGQLEIEQGHFEEALNYYNLSLKEYNGNFKAYLQKSLFYSSVAKYFNLDSALHYAHKSIEVNPFYADAYNTLSWLYLNKQKYPLAKKFAFLSIQNNQQYTLGYNTIGYLYQIENKYDSALYYYQRAIEMDSTIPEIRKNRAWILFQTSQYIKAIHDYNYVLQQKPDDIVALTNRAFCHVHQQQFHLALNDFKKVLSLQPDSSDSYYNIAWTYIQAKQLDSALNYLHKTIHLNPNHIKALFDRGMIHFNKQNYSIALQNFFHLKHILPNNGEILFWIGKVFQAQKQQDSACYYFKAAFNKGFLFAKDQISSCIN